MAFTLRPNGQGDFEAYCEIFPEKFCNEVFAVYESLKKRKNAPYPVILDPSKKKTIKISTSYDPSITKEMKGEFPHLSFKYGEGSFGNRGVYNRGIAYENALVKIIGDSLNDEIPCAEIALIEHIRHRIGRQKPYRVEQIGGTNTVVRIPTWSSEGLRLGSGIADIGNLVGDIAVSNEHGTVYISVKTTKNYTLTNIGAKKFFCKNTQTVLPLGKHLLEMLHINEPDFLEVFSSYGKNDIDKRGYTDKPVIDSPDKIGSFLASCYGFGYVSFCRNYDPQFIAFEDCMNKTRVREVSIVYPDFGKSKRVVVNVHMHDSPTMQVVIRNKNRGIYPDVIEIRAQVN